MADQATTRRISYRAAVREAMGNLNVSQVMTGYRGRPPGDIDAAVAAILAVAAFAEARAETLVELDINPLIVCAAGKGAVAADALIRLREEKP